MWVRLVFCPGFAAGLVVSIHAPVWVRRSRVAAVARRQWFQSTHPCGCDNCPSAALILIKCFNPRTRVGATKRAEIIITDRGVSIHAPVWVRRGVDSCQPKKAGFNPRTRVGATAASYGEFTPLVVSIHAPVWVRPIRLGITASDFPSLFQSTHPCGCDEHIPAQAAPGNSFNPRTRVGATFFSLRSFPPFDEFQSTHPCGCDSTTLTFRASSRCFNPRTRVGATVIARPVFDFVGRFNPRTRVGATRFSYLSNFNNGVSIHAPVWVRRRVPRCRAGSFRFNPRTRVGATISSVSHGCNGKVSIHAPVWVRRFGIFNAQIKMRFQSTHPCGCDSGRRKPAPGPCCFNPRTRVGATIQAENERWQSPRFNPRTRVGATDAAVKRILL